MPIEARRARLQDVILTPQPVRATNAIGLPPTLSTNAFGDLVTIYLRHPDVENRNLRPPRRAYARGFQEFAAAA